MALSTAELTRIKAELGFNVLTVGAEPFIGVTQLFSQIIAVYMTAGAATTSATTVAAASLPTPVAIALASAAGFASGDRIWIDVDDRQESATIQSLSGSSATVALVNAHTGTYPVSVDGGEAIVRDLLARIKGVKDRLATTFGAGALKQVDEIQFYNTGTKTLFGNLGDELMFWRDELASVLGAPNLWRQKRSGGSSISVY